jgi:hypothetical protein
MEQSNKQGLSPCYFTLHQKRPGAAYQACFSYFGEVKWVGTGEVNQRQAIRKAREMQKEILEELTLRAALNGKIIRSKNGMVFSTAAWSGTSAMTSPTPLDTSKPAPAGSFREKIEAQLNFVVANKPSRHAKRDATNSQKHLYEALGGYVDLAITTMDASMGARLAGFYNDPTRFAHSRVHYACQMRRFLRPMLAHGLPPAFIAALDGVQYYPDECDARDPLTPGECARIKRRLQLGLAQRLLQSTTDAHAVEAGAMLELWLLLRLASHGS